MTCRCCGRRSADVPTAKTIDDLKRLTEEIMPKVNAA